MKYNPQNPLSTEEIDNLSPDEFLEYLDSKSEFLNKQAKAISMYDAKKYAYMSAAISRTEISDKHHRDLNKRKTDF
jgi:hypothetical protein